MRRKRLRKAVSKDTYLSLQYVLLKVIHLFHLIQIDASSKGVIWMSQG